MKLHIVLADDTPVSLQTWVSLLDGKFEISAKATDGISALEAIRTFKPDVAVLDFNMPGLNGIEITRRAIQDQLNLAVILCSVPQDPEVIQAAAAAGVRGYVFKGNLFRDLVKAVKSVATGITYFPEYGSQGVCHSFC